MKRLTLDQTWEQCLAMFDDVSGRVGTPSEATVKVMKIQWLNSQGYDDFPDENCFFCEYVLHISDHCKDCPGRLVDPEFDCSNNDYEWETRPRLFYAELKRLNKLRLAK